MGLVTRSVTATLATLDSVALALALTLVTSYAPGAEGLRNVEQAALGCGAVFMMGLALLLRCLPRLHWIHRSRPLWAGFVAVAVTLTVLLVLTVIG
jgi:hypothetical protein